MGRRKLELVSVLSNRGNSIQMGRCKCGTEILSKAKQCSPCAKNYMVVWRTKQIENGIPKHDVYNYRWRQKNPEAYLLQGAKSRAKKKGMEFNIDIKDIIIPNKCPVFNIPLELVWGQGTKNNKPSLDRIDSSLGYIKGNVQVISWRANSIKSDSTLEELKELVRFMENG